MSDLHAVTAPDIAPVALRGERPTEALDTTDADVAFHDLLNSTRDPVAAAILVGALLVAEAIGQKQ